MTLEKSKTVANTAENEPSKTSPPYDLYIISHTHWDREWYRSFEQTRQLLVDVVDHTLDTLEKDLRFTCFHLDGQTSTILDYLEIKPRNKNRLLKLAKQGRLLGGPFYTLNDFFLTSGESTVRNLLMGHTDCEELKIKPLKVGYVLDQFGHFGQMPQILNNFNMRCAVLGRGIQRDTLKQNTFYWKSPDGTKCLTSHLTQWYNNLQRLANNIDDAVDELDLIVKGQKDKLLGRAIALYHGVDHLDIQPELPDLIEEIRRKGYPHNLIHTSIADFFKALNKEARENKVVLTLKGELRQDLDIAQLCGTLSTRMYLKQLNFRIARRIEHYLEPLCVQADLAAPGFYPLEQLQYLWRTYMQCHPHDSITGCGVDETNRQVFARLMRVEDLTEYLTRRAGEVVADQIKVNPEKNPGAEQLLMVWNPTNHPRSEAMELTVELPIAEMGAPIPSPVIYPLNEKNKPLSYKILSVEEGYRRIVFPIRIPTAALVKQIKVFIQIPEIPPLGYRAFVLSRGEAVKPSAIEIKNLSPDNAQLENEFLKVDIHSDGTFDLIDKGNNSRLENLHFFEDSGDSGHEYAFYAPKHNKIISTKGSKASILQLENDRFRKRVKILLEMNIPEGLDFTEVKRKPLEIPHQIETILTLRTGSPVLEIETHFENMAEYHRLRAAFPVSMVKPSCLVESAFEIIDRTPGKGVNMDCAGHPTLGFVDIRDSKKGLALFSDGLPEYDFNAESNCLYLTLLRAVGDLDATQHPKFRNNIFDFKTPEAQCFGSYTFRYALYCHKGNVPVEEIKRQSDLYLNPPDTFVSLIDTTEWIKRNPDKENMFHYFEPPMELLYPHERKLEASQNLLQCDNPALIFSALKKSERLSDAYICRFFNITGKKQEAKLTFARPLREACEANLNEQPRKKIAFENKTLRVSVKPYKIITILVKF